MIDFSFSQWLLIGLFSFVFCITSDLFADFVIKKLRERKNKKDDIQ